MTAFAAMTTQQRIVHPPHRAAIKGTRHMVAAGHHLAAQAGLQILEAGGNAVDAGVAAGIALGVVQSDMVNVAGVAPIMVYMAGTRELKTVSGLGCWPQSVTVDYFQRQCQGIIPFDIRRTVVPGAPDAWITALERWGTMSFGEVVAAATRFARDGFAISSFMASQIAERIADYGRFPSTRAIYLPGGRPPASGDLFVQADLGRTLQYMADEERAHANGDRRAGLAAARRAFYQSDIAQTIDAFFRAEGGFLTYDDMAKFRVEVEDPPSVRFGDFDVYACGPWCQGPVLLQALSILNDVPLKVLGHNSPSYLHMLVEASKLAFADRERWYGDPRFVDVPMAGLLDRRYALQRRTLLRADQAAPGMPPAGDPINRAAIDAKQPRLPPPSVVPPPPPGDTSYVCVVDRWGNAFSATPSDVTWDSPVVPGTGLCPSSRGSQSRADPDHPASVAPGKRPRLTPNPAMAFRNGKPFMPFGTPGGDGQTQAMLQVFLNIALFGMDAQAAVEAPRFITNSFPNSFAPNDYYPGRLNLERRMGQSLGETLDSFGHDVTWWPDWFWRGGSVCAIVVDETTGILHAGADPRQGSTAAGW